MIVIESEAGTSTYYSKEKILISTYKGKFKFDSALKHYQKVFDFHIKNGVKGDVIDISKLFGSFYKLLNFIKDTYPAIAKSGLVCCAYVVDDDIIVNNLLGKVAEIEKPLNLKTAIFKDKEEALTWVKSILK